jgi:hypothetical protein
VASDARALTLALPVALAIAAASAAGVLAASAQLGRDH